MNVEEDLRQTEANGHNWYKSYSGHLTSTKLKLVIVPTTHPDVLRADKSIYTPRDIFDLATSTAKTFYESRGLKSIVAGPTGLGATGYEIFGSTVQWLIDHKEILIPVIRQLARSLFRSYKLYKEDQREASLRSAKFRIHLDLALYVDEGSSSKDLVPYMQQLLASFSALSAKLNDATDYVDYFVSYRVFDIRSEAKIYVNLSDVGSISIQAINRKLKKMKPSNKNIKINVSRNFFFGFKVN